MPKPPKLDLKAIIAGPANAPEPAPEAPPQPAAPAAATVVPLAAARTPVRSAKAGAPAGQGTLKNRARQMSLYLEPAVYDQLRDLAYTERTKIHPLLIEAVDLLFRKRGLKSVKQLSSDTSQDQRTTG